MAGQQPGQGGLFGLGGSNPPLSGFSFTSNPPPTTATPVATATGFSFGTPAFGTPPPAPAATSTAAAPPLTFGFGSAAAAPPTGPPPTTAHVPPAGFNFAPPAGTAAAPAAAVPTGATAGSAAPTGFGFGAPPPAPTSGAGATSGFTFGASAVPAPAATTGVAPAQMAAPPNFQFKSPATTAVPGAASVTPAFSFGTPAGSTTSSTLGASPSLATTQPGLGLGTTLAPSAVSSSITAPTPSKDVGSSMHSLFKVPPPSLSAATVASTIPSATATATPSTAAPALAFSLGGAKTAAPTTATATGFSLGATTSAPAATGFSLGGRPPTTTAAAGSTSAPVMGLTTATTTTASAAVPPSGASMSFRQLEELINKWTLELEEQERTFLRQATQVNAWDHLLNQNGEKIVSLNEAVERVKADQQQLEHELDFVAAQQRELEELLVPLERAMEGGAASCPADPEREHTYQLAESVDAQLKKMAGDLKEVIEHLNAANRTQDSQDPIVQVGRILNAHMDSLQWIDDSTNVLQRKLQEVTKMHEVQKRDMERSFNLAYN